MNTAFIFTPATLAVKEMTDAWLRGANLSVSENTPGRFISHYTPFGNLHAGKKTQVQRQGGEKKLNPESPRDREKIKHLEVVPNLAYIAKDVSSSYYTAEECVLP